MTLATLCRKFNAQRHYRVIWSEVVKDLQHFSIFKGLYLYHVPQADRKKYCFFSQRMLQPSF